MEKKVFLIHWSFKNNVYIKRFITCLPTTVFSVHSGRTKTRIVLSIWIFMLITFLIATRTMMGLPGAWRPLELVICIDNP